MIVPNAIDDAPPHQRIVRMRKPAGECGAASGFVSGTIEWKANGQSGYTGERTGHGFFQRLADVAALEHVNGAGLACRLVAAVRLEVARRRINERRFWKGGELLRKDGALLKSGKCQPLLLSTRRRRLVQKL